MSETATAGYLAATRTLVELTIGRPLRLAEQVVDVFALTAALDNAKDDLHAAIEAEKRRAIRHAMRTGHPVRLRLTTAMLRPLERLYDLGVREATAELHRAGYNPGRLFAEGDATSANEHLAALETRVRSGLNGLSVKVENERVSAVFGGVVHQALADALLNVPGGKSIAAEVVSTAMFSGMGQTFEQNADLVSGWQYSAVLDGGTCDRCGPLDGTTYDTLEALFEVLPGFGPNPSCLGGGRCRCRGVPADAAQAPPAPPPPAPEPPLISEPLPSTATVGAMQKGDVFLYDGHCFKVLGEKRGGVEVQHIKTKARQIAAHDLQVELPAKRAPSAASLVGRSAETHLNELQRGLADRLTDTELRDLDNYVGVSYRTINGDLRGGRELGSVSAKRVANIDTAITKSVPLDQETTLWRGLNSWRVAFGDGDLDSLVGRTVSDPGFASTTTRQKIAYRSMGGKGKFAAVVKVRAPQGQQGAWISGLAKPAGSRTARGLEHHLAREEGEFLLPRDTKFRVVSVKHGTIPEIEVEIVP